MPNRRHWITQLLPVIAGAIAGAIVALIIAGGSSDTKSVTTRVVQPSAAAGEPAAFGARRGLTINQIYRMAGPGVVDIITTSTSANPGFPFPGGGTQQTQGEGAGVVYDSRGNILTDEHVVSGAQSVQVTFQNGRKAPATVVGTDPSTDVAVIHVNVPASELHPIPFADSSKAQVGDPVVAIGSPFQLPQTTTAGIVSATGRGITAPNQYTIASAIQTDAAINPGNSGGPLLNADGRVLGLNDQIQTQSGSSAGVGFAVPSNTAARVANQIIGGHQVRHAYVGVELNSSLSGGAGIGCVNAGSPAGSAGLHRGDRVVAINRTAVGSTEQFIATIDSFKPGQTVTLTVRRGSQTLKMSVQLGTRPAAAGGGCQG